MKSEFHVEDDEGDNFTFYDDDEDDVDDYFIGMTAKSGETDYVTVGIQRHQAQGFYDWLGEILNKEESNGR